MEALLNKTVHTFIPSIHEASRGDHNFKANLGYRDPASKQLRTGR